jgi:MoaA/NifB/PqqE/SkfB family radical SAM enzyme
VVVSVDGSAEQHDAVRGQPGLYQHLRRYVRDLRDHKRAAGRGPLLRANTILMHSNVRAFERLGDELAGWGVEEVTFNALGGARGDPFYEAERLQPEDVAWLAENFDPIRFRLARRGLLVRASRRYLERLDHSARGAAWPVADCAPGDRFWFVDERGRLAPCRFTGGEYGVPVSELRTLADLHALPQRMAAARSAALAAVCGDCHSPQVFGKFALEVGV